jgi:hypothetical protein
VLSLVLLLLLVKPLPGLRISSGSSSALWQWQASQLATM